MPGLAAKITKDFRSQKKEDLIENAIKDSFRSTWFTDYDIKKDLPILEGEQFKKIIKVDGSDLYAKKYAPAASAILWSISPITCVRNKANIKPDGFNKVKVIKKKPTWPELNFQHTFEYVKERDENLNVLKLQTTQLDRKKLDADNLPEKAIIIGTGISRRRAITIEVKAVLNDDYTVDFIEINYVRSRKKALRIKEGSKVSMEDYVEWQQSREQ